MPRKRTTRKPVKAAPPAAPAPPAMALVVGGTVIPIRVLRGRLYISGDRDGATSLVTVGGVQPIPAGTWQAVTAFVDLQNDGMTISDTATPAEVGTAMLYAINTASKQQGTC